MDGNGPWSDLPHDLVTLIVNKLHFPDQVCALAVCKNWRDCKYYVRCSDTLPWVMFHEKKPIVKSGRLSFVWCLIDPYLEKAYKVSNSLDMDPNLSYVRLTSKHGWAWVIFKGSELSFPFFHNPFTNELHSVPGMAFVYMDDPQATIKGNPTSPECEIFTLGLSATGELRMYSSTPSGITSEFIVKMSENDVLCSVLYMKASIYCLFWNGKLNRYSLGDKSWKLLTEGFPEPYELCDDMADCWLLEINENLIMVRLDLNEEYNWMIFGYEWCGMSWVVETGLKSCAIYISDNVAFSGPLSNWLGEILEGCRVFYLDKDEGKFKCYSWSEAMGSEIQSAEYDWIPIPSEYEFCFIQPPYFGI